MKFQDIFDTNTRNEDGAWVTEGFAFFPDLALKVRGAGCALASKRAKEIREAASEEERKDEGFWDRANASIILDVLLLDWKIDDQPFTREAAERALQSPLFRDAVIWASSRVAEIGKITLDADTKN